MSRFTLDRLLRLGLPLLVFGFVLDSLTVALAYAHSPLGAALLWWRLIAGGRFWSGTMWFAEALLIFAAFYVIWRVFRRAAGRTDRPLPGHRAIFLAALAVGATAFALFVLAGTLACVASVTVGSLILLIPGSRRLL